MPFQMNNDRQITGFLTRLNRQEPGDGLMKRCAKAPPVLGSQALSVSISSSLLCLIVLFFLTSPAWAQPSTNTLPENRSASTGTRLCEGVVTTTCLVAEIQSFLASDMDQFKRQRATLALAQAQLADGRVKQALASYEQLEATTAIAEFLVSYAKRLIADGDNNGALERLREANSLLTEGQSDLDRLNATRQRQSIAETFAQAGAAKEGRAILEEIASYRTRIPLNPLLVALILQVSQADADIGFRDEAATILAETYALTLDQDVQATPELILQIFETWASLDVDAATSAAEELAKAIGTEDPSAFELAIWTGLSAGLTSLDANVLERAEASFVTAPGRSAALLLVPKLSGAMKKAGKAEQARALLERARVEAADALTAPMEKAPVLLALAESFASDNAPKQATTILDELLAMPQETGPAGMALRHYANAIPAQLASIGKIDEAYDLAMKADSGIRDLSLVMAADKLATLEKYHEAMRFLHEVEGEIAVMMMAGMAERFAYAPAKQITP